MSFLKGPEGPKLYMLKRSSDTSDSVEGKPKDPPKNDDFKRYLDEDKDEENSSNVASPDKKEKKHADAPSDAAAAAAPNIFDMSSKAKPVANLKKESSPDPMALASQGAASPFVDSELGAKKPKTLQNSKTPIFDGDDSLAAKAAHENSTPLVFSNIQSVDDPKMHNDTKALNSLVTQLVEAMTTLKDTGKTEINLTLKQPPAFAGATVTMIEFQSAPKQFNVSFHNLSNDARALLENFGNLDALKLAMDMKGFAIHIITTSNEPKPTATTQSEESKGQQQRDDQDNADQEEGRRQKKR